MNNLMLDLETLDNTPTAAIVAIGAVRFDRSGLGAKFYRPISIEGQTDHGLTIGADTLAWWMRQSDDARAVFHSEHRLLWSALVDFEHFINPDVLIWGNGADFDNAILAHAFAALDIAQPWKFWNNRCYRTAKNLYPDIKLNRFGTHHNALDDAISQAQHLIEIANAHGLPL